MMAHLLSLLNIRSSDPDIQRRGRNVVIVGSGLSALAILLIVVAMSQQAPPIAPVVLGAASAVFLSTTFLARSGRVTLGALLIIATSILGNLTIVATDPNAPSLPFFLIVATLLGTVLLPPALIWVVLLLCAGGAFLTTALFAPELRSSHIWNEAKINSTVLMGTVAIIGYLSARGTRAALAQADSARADAERTSQLLATTNATLELRVEERTAALRAIADQHRAVAEELQSSLSAQQELNRIVAELSVPIIPVSADTLVVPLVGAIDSARAQHALSGVLAHVEHGDARTIILDITGVAVVDTQVATMLLQLAAAARLMGTMTILAGIRPEVAQTLVQLGVNLSGIRTVATLQECLMLRVRP
ncbi:MAG: STAS domain-containing protein [Kouleothrix sp.]|nr:STAS domain-containing protein [Kouleothrix sp.]